MRSHRSRRAGHAVGCSPTQPVKWAPAECSHHRVNSSLRDKPATHYYTTHNHDQTIIRISSSIHYSDSSTLVSDNSSSQLILHDSSSTVRSRHFHLCTHSLLHTMFPTCTQNTSLLDCSRYFILACLSSPPLTTVALFVMMVFILLLIVLLALLILFLYCCCNGLPKKSIRLIFLNCICVYLKEGCQRSSCPMIDTGISALGEGTLLISLSGPIIFTCYVRQAARIVTTDPAAQ